MFFFTPSFLTAYGCAVAALVLPTASALDALSSVDATGRARLPAERTRRICAQLRYWLAYSMIWSLARELSRGALSWFPFWRHAELASVFWLVVFGGAEEVARQGAPSIVHATVVAAAFTRRFFKASHTPMHDRVLKRHLYITTVGTPRVSLKVDESE